MNWWSFWDSTSDGAWSKRTSLRRAFSHSRFMHRRTGVEFTTYVPDFGFDRCIQVRPGNKSKMLELLSSLKSRPTAAIPIDRAIRGEIMDALVQELMMD